MRIICDRNDWPPTPRANGITAVSPFTLTACEIRAHLGESDQELLEESVLGLIECGKAFMAEEIHQKRFTHRLRRRVGAPLSKPALQDRQQISVIPPGPRSWTSRFF